MKEEYSPEKIWKIYRNLPENLKEAIFSVETADNIYNICEKNGIDKVSRVAKLVGYTLLGLLPPEKLQRMLKKELKITPALAKKVTQEISRFIFYPVRKSLSEIYKIETLHQEIETASQESKKTQDIYREPIE